MLSNPLHDRRDEHRVHLGDGAVFAPEILQGRAKVVEFSAVEDQEPVVEGGDGLYGQRRVLLVELGNCGGREELRDAFLKREVRLVRSAEFLG